MQKMELLVVVGILGLLALTLFGPGRDSRKPIAEHNVVIKVQERFPNPLGDGEVEYRIICEDGRTVITYDAALYASLKKNWSYKVRCEEYGDGRFVVVFVLEENPAQY